MRERKIKTGAMMIKETDRFKVLCSRLSKLRRMHWYYLGKEDWIKARKTLFLEDVLHRQVEKEFKAIAN